MVSAICEKSQRATSSPVFLPQWLYNSWRTRLRKKQCGDFMVRWMYLSEPQQHCGKCATQLLHAAQNHNGAEISRKGTHANGVRLYALHNQKNICQETSLLTKFISDVLWKCPQESKPVWNKILEFWGVQRLLKTIVFHIHLTREGKRRWCSSGWYSRVEVWTQQ